MDSRKYSGDRRRHSRNVQSDTIITDRQFHQDLEEASSASDKSPSNIDQRSRYQRVTRLPPTHSTSRHENVNLSGPDETFNNECSSESDEVSVVEQIGGDPADPEERSDENTSNRFNIKSPLKETTEILDKQEKRKKSRRRRWRKDNCIPTAGTVNEENPGEDRHTVIMKQRRLSSSSKNDSDDGTRRSKRKKNKTKGKIDYLFIYL